MKTFVKIKYRIKDLKNSYIQNLHFLNFDIRGKDVCFFGGLVANQQFEKFLGLTFTLPQVELGLQTFFFGDSPSIFEKILRYF